MKTAAEKTDRSTEVLAAIRALEDVAKRASPALAARPKLKAMFERCFMSTIATTTEYRVDGTAFVLTGDIPAMWLRDSSAQVSHYLPWAARFPEVRRIVEGLVRRQLRYILIDPYANAFNRDPSGSSFSRDKTAMNPWLWERKYEVDSLCYPLELSYRLWKSTGSTAAFGGDFGKALDTVIDQWTLEQKHGERSPYRFEREDCPESDTLPNAGAGAPVAYTGMTWSGFRPSDDACRYGYLIPANMFAAVTLGHAAEIARSVLGDAALAGRAMALRAQIDEGIRTYGVYPHPAYGDIFAYEADGMGRYNLMDDANAPSLLSIPYLGYCGADDPVYQNTRRFILSRDNPYFYEGRYARGIGSPHTPQGYVWHIALTMQALTSTDPEEIAGVVDTLERTDAGTLQMHEGFNPDNPDEFTRPWFAWANSLFSELICRVYGIAP
jgi:meiotically up-regulated gene 157 (Mug157) protein